MSPNFGGAQVMIQHDAGESTTSSTLGKDSHATSVGATFKSGPISVAVSTESRKEVRYLSTGLVALSNTPVLGPNAAVNKTFDEVTHQAVGASYNLGMATVSVLSTQVKFKDATAADNGKIDTNMVGVTVPLGKVSLMASVSQGSIEDNGTETYDNSAYQIIAQYDLSKRTNAYAAIGQTKFDSPTADTDAKIKQVGIGLRHSF
jgi:predicted porin